MRKILWFLAGAAVWFAIDWLLDLRQAPIPTPPTSDSPAASLDALAASLVEAGEFVRGHHWYGSDRERTEAYRHILRQLVNSLEGNALMDPDFPYFHEINTRTKAGMDNSDQRYLIALFNGDGVYRVWGHRGSSRRLDFTVYGLDDLSPSVSTLATDDLKAAADGSFEVIIGGEPRDHNWLDSEAGLQRLLVRQIHADWPNETPGEVHIDRIDTERPDYPTLDDETFARRINLATDKFNTALRRWPEMSRTRIAKFIPVNSLSPPRDTGVEGGLAGRLMVAGHFKLEQDEALVITAWPSEADYQGIQLGHHWWESLDYANRQTSITADQARISSDGAYHFVIAASDPGVVNWLDTEGFSRGVILMRYDGLPVPELAKEKHPRAQLVKLNTLWNYLPGDEPRVSPEERAAAIAERRRHVQRRFGY